MQHQLQKVLKELRKARDQISKLESAVSVSAAYNLLFFEPVLLKRWGGGQIKLKVKAEVAVFLLFRNRQTAGSQSPARTTAWSLSAWPSATPVTPRLRLRSPAFWTRASWNVRSVAPAIPPAATGSSWHTSTSAWPESEQSTSQLQFPKAD